jgi:hypothetical protein
MFASLQLSGMDLKTTDRQIECIETILYSLSEKSTGSLLFDAFHLKAVGKEIDKVPPLEFLYHVMERGDLSTYMKNIRKRYFQWNAFISGFTDKCNDPFVYAGIKQSLKDFSQSVKIDEEILSPFIEKRDWQKLVEYLLIRREI